MSMQPWQTSLAYAPLQPAFTRWVEHEGHDMSAWVDPEQQVQAPHRPCHNGHCASCLTCSPKTQHMAGLLWKGPAAL